MPMTAATLSDAIVLALAARGEATALEIDGDAVSAPRLIGLIAARQATLAEAGVKAGAPVLVPSGQGLGSLVDLLAAWVMGAVAVPYDPGLAPAVAEVLVEIAEPAAIVVAGPAMEGLETTAARLDPMAADLAPAEAGLVPTVVDPNDLAAILFTSGSTGRPKGVRLSHEALMGNIRGTLANIRLKAGDRLFIAVPFHFTSAIHHVLSSLLSGAVLVGTERALIQASLSEAVKAARATCFGGAPIQLRWLAEVAAHDGALPLNWVMSSGDHLPVEVIEALAANMPKTRVHTVYGLTEVGGRLCFLDPALLPAKAGSVGRPMDGLSVAIRDEHGAVIETPDIEGEITVTGDWLFDGYHRNPEETAKALRGGVFFTGDLGRLDADGCLTVAGRVDDVFKSAGQKVSVVPIAAAMMETGLFADVAVWPVEHPRFGKVPHAFYVPKDGAPFKRGPVLKALRAKLPANHLPQGFTPVSSVPRTGSGKIRRGEMKALAAGIEAGFEG